MRGMNLLCVIAIVTGAACQVSASSGKPTATIKTNQGTIVIELDRQKAPKTVENFIAYAKDGFYDGTIFHRVIDGFMIQGGGFTPALDQKKTRAPVVNESKDGLKNLRGTIAMARRGDPDSATSQFFINVVDNASLDFGGFGPGKPGYTVFGRVTKGMDVVDKIKAVKTLCSSRQRGGPCDPQKTKRMQDVPVEPVVIEKVTIK